MTQQANGIDWDELARSRVYSSSKRMLVEMYYVRGLSLSELAESIGISAYALREKMEELNLPRREIGGANNTIAGFICPYCGSSNATVDSNCHMRDGEYMRWRLCQNESCKRRFKTVEVAQLKDAESTS